MILFLADFVRGAAWGDGLGVNEPSQRCHATSVNEVEQIAYFHDRQQEVFCKSLWHMPFLKRTRLEI